MLYSATALLFVVRHKASALGTASSLAFSSPPLCGRVWERPQGGNPEKDGREGGMNRAAHTGETTR